MGNAGALSRVQFRAHVLQARAAPHAIMLMTDFPANLTCIRQTFMQSQPACRKHYPEEISRDETITCAVHACELGHRGPEGGSKVGTEGLGRGGRHTICQKRFGTLTAVTCESAKYAV